MKVIGLTGGIGTGKSTVAELLRARGVPVVDADQAARAVVRPGSPALAEIVAAFGPEVLSPEGELDRARMRARISQDRDARRALEAITHPAIRSAIAEELAALGRAGHPVAVVEAALLVETGSYQLYPALLVVSCSPEQQLSRVMARDGASEAEARALIAAQLPLVDKERVATAVIRNDGDLATLAQAVDRAWERVSRT